MRVLFDYQAFSIQDCGGVSRCFSELYKHLPDDIEADLGLLESNNEYVQGWKGVHPAGYGYSHFICERDFPGKGHLHLWTDCLRKPKYYPNYNKNYCIELLKKGTYDVFHPTYFDPYFLPYLNGKPFVLTIHDMIPELFDGLDERQKENKAELSKRATHIIAVSHHTKKDIINLLHIPEERVSVVHHGAPDNLVINDVPLFPFPYLVYSGSRYRYKNFLLMLRHLRDFLTEHPALRLVCTGANFTEREKTVIADLNLSDSIIHRFIDERDLGTLYHHALCLIYPSAYEGFGLPILEAYKAECPVLLNRASCFPEIAGDAALYFEISDDTTNLADVLETLLNFVPQERAALIERQNRRVLHYSWRNSAQCVADVYRQVLLR